MTAPYGEERPWLADSHDDRRSFAIPRERVLILGGPSGQPAVLLVARTIITTNFLLQVHVDEQCDRPYVHRDPANDLRFKKRNHLVRVPSDLHHERMLTAVATFVRSTEQFELAMRE